MPCPVRNAPGSKSSPLRGETASRMRGSASAPSARETGGVDHLFFPEPAGFDAAGREAGGGCEGCDEDLGGS